MKTITLRTGEKLPALGMGTWQIGEDARTRSEELATLRLGLDLGARVIDTAEMYGEGESERLIGEAIEGRREEVFLVSKVYPHNASKEGTPAACERSLRRLKTEYLDLYLLHWPGQVPLEETLDALADLQRAGKIRNYGVSNFDRRGMEKVWSLRGGEAVATNQLLYNLLRRGIEWDVLPGLRERSVPLMAYSPVEQGKLVREPTLKKFARSHGMTPAQAALSWLLSKEDVLVIPKTGDRRRLRENMGALEHPLSATQLAELDRLFPPPSGPTSLEML